MTLIDQLEKVAAQFDADARAVRQTIALLQKRAGTVPAAAFAAKFHAATRSAKSRKIDAVRATLNRLWADGANVRTRDVVDRVRADAHVKVSHAFVLAVLNADGARLSGRVGSNRATWAPPPSGPLVPDSAATNGNGDAPDDRSRRMVDLLARFDKAKPRTIAQIRADGADAPVRGIGPMLRAGYLKKKRGGYVLGKPYVTP